MPAAAEVAVRAAGEIGSSYYLDAASRSSAERDFGGIARGTCLLVVEPRTPAECADFIGALNHHRLGCTLRGSGYGQSGQSVACDTVSLNTRRLDEVSPVDASANTITVGAGVTLRRVVLGLRDSHMVPPSLPLNLDMTVGGLLSAGGLGPASHRYGPVASNVLQMKVVTGGGELRVCTPGVNSDLFNLVLGGAGQGGVITEATLLLRRTAGRKSVFSFLYSDVGTWLRDQVLASQVDCEVDIEGFCWVGAKGARSGPAGITPFTRWMYSLVIAADSDAVDGVAMRNLLGSLRPLDRLGEYSIELGPYLQRYEPRFSSMVESGAWDAPHPWYEGLIPLDRAEEVVAQMLQLLPTEVGDGHRFMLVDTRRLPASFACWPGRTAALVGIFPVAFAQSSLPRVLGCMERLTALVLDAGGRRYISGWLGPNPGSYFRAHYGDRFGAWLAQRRQYDPNGVLRSKLFPNGHRE